MLDLMEHIEEAYSPVTSLEGFHDATIALAADVVDADLYVLASEVDGTMRPLASRPPDWTDTDDLLSPVSLPCLAVADDTSCIVDDRSNVRCAAPAAPVSPSRSSTYLSVIAVPFVDAGMLLAGSHDVYTFDDADLERLRLVSTAASAIKPTVDHPQASPQHHESLDEAAAVLSHDARNFLAIIRGQLELAKETGENARFDAIERSATRLEALIDDTATLLRTGSTVTDTEAVSLRDVATVAWESVEMKDADLFTPSSVAIEADRTRLCQLFENLLRNAVEHAGPDVDVWIGTLADESGFFFEDDGPGFEADALDDPFEFGYSTGDHHTGFGLAIVEWIAEAHGWDVSATNASSGGARIEFRNVKFVDDA